MRVLITGAGGFIGTVLTRALLDCAALKNSENFAQPIERIMLADIHLPIITDARLERIQGDLADHQTLQRIAEWRPDSIFHLAAILTSAAERDPARALAINVSSFARLIEIIGSTHNPPRLIYPSSIAVFGGRLPDVVNDDIVQRPQTAYGTHKSIVELMLADATRRGEIDGRALRLPIVLVHPGPATSSVSDSIAGIVRDAVAGRDVVLPLSGETCIPVVSIKTVTANLITIHDFAAGTLHGVTALNQPALTVSIAGIVSSLRETLRAPSLNFVFKPDPALEAIVHSWPKGFVSQRANDLGISGNTSFDEIVRDYSESLRHA